MLVFVGIWYVVVVVWGPTLDVLVIALTLTIGIKYTY